MEKGNARMNQSTEIVVGGNSPHSQISRVVISGDFSSIVYKYIRRPINSSDCSGCEGEGLALSLEVGETKHGREQTPELANYGPGVLRTNSEETGTVHAEELATDYNSIEDSVARRKAEESVRYGLKDSKVGLQGLTENSEITASSSRRPIYINTEVMLPSQLSTGNDVASMAVSVCQNFAGFEIDSGGSAGNSDKFRTGSRAKNLRDGRHRDSIRIGIKVGAAWKHEHVATTSSPESCSTESLQTEVAGSSLSSQSIDEQLVSPRVAPESELNVEGRDAYVAGDETLERHELDAYVAEQQTKGKQVLDEYDRRVSQMVMNRVRGPSLPFRGTLLTPQDKEAMLAEAAAEEFQIPKGIVKRMSLRLAEHLFPK